SAALTGAEAPSTSAPAEIVPPGMMRAHTPRREPSDSRSRFERIPRRWRDRLVISTSQDPPRTMEPGDSTIRVIRHNLPPTHEDTCRRYQRLRALSFRVRRRGGGTACLLSEHAVPVKRNASGVRCLRRGHLQTNRDADVVRKARL